MNIKAIAVALLLLAAVPSASASCMSAEQILALNQLAASANVSAITLIGIFEDGCNRTYTAAQIDLKFNSTAESDRSLARMIESQNSSMDARFADYTRAIEKELDVARMVAAFTEIFNASNSLEQIDSRVQQKLDRHLDDVNLRVKDLKSEAEARYVQRIDLGEFRSNMTNEMMSMASGIESNLKASSPAWAPWAVAFGVIAILGWYAWGRRKRLSRKSRALLRAPDAVEKVTQREAKDIVSEMNRRKSQERRAAKEARKAIEDELETKEEREKARTKERKKDIRKQAGLKESEEVEV